MEASGRDKWTEDILLSVGDQICVGGGWLLEEFRNRKCCTRFAAEHKKVEHATSGARDILSQSSTLGQEQSNECAGEKSRSFCRQLKRLVGRRWVLTGLFYSGFGLPFALERTCTSNKRSNRPRMEGK